MITPKKLEKLISGAVMGYRTCKRILLTYGLAYCAKGLLRLILSTCRFEVVGLENLNQTAEKRSCILMLWHNRLAIMSEFLRKFAPQHIYSAFISNSNDGEALAILANSYSFGRTIRVPHAARYLALKTMIRRLRSQKEVVIITPDGPKGPAYRIKPGIGAAAIQASAPIIPLTWVANNFWQFGTWDKLILPKPFSKITVSIGSPISLSKQAEDFSEPSQELEQTMHSLEKSIRPSI